jgi:hypothetical protein
MKDHLEDQEVDGRITLKWIRLDWSGSVEELIQ